MTAQQVDERLVIDQVAILRFHNHTVSNKYL
jgi:hypothetical protein